ncbi:MAG: hypothetical protein ACJ72Z_04440 [Pyrinomonadaceae bacterium]
MIASLLTVLSLLAASVSAACYCGHHESGHVEKTEPLSCHGSTHEEPVVDENVPIPYGDLIGLDCECFPQSSVASIVSKYESKRFKSENLKAAANAETVRIGSTSFRLIDDTFHGLTSVNLYKQALPRSGPSRAPPRL